jgi:hypothetical protein
VSLHFTPSHHEKTDNLGRIGTYRVTNAIAKFMKIRKTLLKVISSQNMISQAVFPYSVLKRLFLEIQRQTSGF